MSPSRSVFVVIRLQGFCWIVFTWVPLPVISFTQQSSKLAGRRSCIFVRGIFLLKFRFCNGNQQKKDVDVAGPQHLQTKSSD
jgi:hypothetical protein